MFKKGKKDDHHREATADNPDPSTGEGAGSASTSPEAPARPSLPVVEQDEPIKAWKVVSLQADRSTVWLRSTYSHEDVRKAQRASCRATHDYLGYFQTLMIGGSSRNLTGSPEIKRHKAPDLGCTCGWYALKQKPWGLAVAEVDLYGTVIEGELGYRAEYQRILSVSLNRETCGGFLCDEPCTLLDFPKDADGDRGTGYPVCTFHATPESVELSKIAKRLGVEVRWADE